MIKGGGGKDSQNGFFSKMLNNNENCVKTDRLSLVKSSGKKMNIDSIMKQQYENEKKILDSDDLNKSNDSDMVIDRAAIDKMKTPQKKDKNGIWNIFSKIISK